MAKKSSPSSTKPRVEFLTNRYGSDRVGTNLVESELTVAKVNVREFGKLFGRPVDGDLYAQPLIVNDLVIGGQKHSSVVFLVTSRNTVYAYDADDPDQSLPLWETNLGAIFNPPRLPVPRDAIFPGYLNFNSEVGITSTPVIDRDKKGKGGILYVVAKTVTSPKPRNGWKDKDFAYHLHALDLLTGKPASTVAKGQPTAIAARAVLKKERPAKDVVAEFTPKMHLNRPGLLLLDGVLYLAFGSHGDRDPFWGWIMAYDAKTLQQVAVHCPAIEWGEGGIWQSGNGLAGETTKAPDGSTHHYVYTVVGNGQRPVIEEDDQLPVVNPMLTADPVNGVIREPVIAEPVYGNCILKLELLPSDGEKVGGRPPNQGDPSSSHRLDVIDWFTVTDCLDLNQNDNDLIAGPVLFDATPKDGTTLAMVLGGGKDGRFYLCDRNNLGKWNGTNPGSEGQVIFNQQQDPTTKKMVAVPDWQPRPPGSVRQNAIYQDDQLAAFHIHGTPVLWKKAEGDITAFVWSENDSLKAYSFDPGTRKFKIPAESSSQYRLPPNELRMPGGFIAVSSDGNKPGTSIVWAAHSTDDDAMNKTVKGTLRAFNADNLNEQIWTSDTETGGRDRLGMLAKFCPPVVANGKVYMSTFSRELVVYGPLTDEQKRQRGGDCEIFDTRGFGRGGNGHCDFTCSQYNLTANGLGLIPDQNSDSFFFAFSMVDADQAGVTIEITAQLLGLMAKPNLEHAVAGLMIRSVGDKSPFKEESMPFAAVLATPKDGAFFLCRTSPNTESHRDLTSPSTVPCWLRLTAIAAAGAGGVGSLEFSGSVSQDGLTWMPINSRTVVPMQGMVRVGLVGTGVATLAMNQATDHVSARFGSVTVFPHSP